ncbi:hypothetical protein CM19_03835 [Candidatus Acidianus copahuensis]|uniref:Uncharacterized protein n=2 Tax=Acidianus TaxID=12914 RepID=A0A031LSB2_9CREN|nr:hypothetical protein [Candidatus Acidianus copahuensis]EZQ10620.1 hypothetical protein CM19_03835 [Candidatus Acidianus copahuensis]NON63594.1 hypothetical protein [Acidianus sp. RZ1]
MVYSLVASGMITLVMLGVAENEVIESLNIDTTVIPRWELRVLFLISSFLIICGILESLLVTFSGILLSFESIPYITVLLSGRLRR